jgi:hypothetical protein
LTRKLPVRTNATSIPSSATVSINIKNRRHKDSATENQKSISSHMMLLVAEKR